LKGTKPKSFRNVKCPGFCHGRGGRKKKTSSIGKQTPRTETAKRGGLPEKSQSRKKPNEKKGSQKRGFTPKGGGKSTPQENIQTKIQAGREKKGGCQTLSGKGLVGSANPGGGENQLSPVSAQKRNQGASQMREKKNSWSGQRKKPRGEGNFSLGETTTEAFVKRRPCGKKNPLGEKKEKKSQRGGAPRGCMGKGPIKKPEKLINIQRGWETAVLRQKGEKPTGTFSLGKNGRFGQKSRIGKRPPARQKEALKKKKGGEKFLRGSKNRRGMYEKMVSPRRVSTTGGGRREITHEETQGPPRRGGGERKRHNLV